MKEFTPKREGFKRRFSFTSKSATEYWVITRRIRRGKK